MTTLDLKVKVLRHALASLENKPPNLARSLRFFGEQLATADCITVAEVLDHAALNNDLNNPIRLALHQALARWDYEPDADWTDGTEPNTSQRRSHIYDLLGLDAKQREQLDEVLPYYAAEQPIVISAEHQRWFSSAAEANSFYWKAYRGYLEESGNWNDDALIALEVSTRSVVERLSDPARIEAFQAKGLVVGYVQSGKTANFTGVVARAADAGYRLIIVLTGMTEILRRQTQRRLDKEMIGREFLDQDYQDDIELDTFISHGARPSRLGYFDWQRLTGPEYDYQSLKRGIDALEFEKANPSKPFFSSENLRTAKARLIVIKKNSGVMNKVLSDLRRIRTRLEDIPTLIIDDESDQASLNTRPPGKERPAVNSCIVKLLGILPRAQYVGYTATPFANVFVDPAQPEDLFPKDFLISLPRPPGYMGVSDFYDLDRQPPYDPNDLTSKRSCFVRPIVGDNLTVPDNLQRAIDSFVLTGAIKLFRKSRGITVRGRHHTMLVHMSHRKADHVRDVAMVQGVLENSDYRGGVAYDRLKNLYEADFLRVTEMRTPEMVLPTDFSELSSYLGDALARISDGKSVLMVNSDADADTPDFDMGPVWKIIVGGSKLSRGYTIEGLTVSYYRRSAKTADTLMQMGRWFGFREGYADLVRLFIGTREPLKGGNTIDLYEAFGAVCRDEELFREQLEKYSSMEDPRVLPIQIPPLVPAHMLRPTSRNKMFNANVQYQNFAKEWAERTMLPTNMKEIKNNKDQFFEMISGTKLKQEHVSFDLGTEHEAFDVVYANIAPAAVIKFLKSYKWLGPNQHLLARELEYMSGSGTRDPEIDGWLLLLPQQKASRKEWQCKLNDETVSVFLRSRVEGDRVGAITEPQHRALAEYAAIERRREGKVPKPPISNLSPAGRRFYKPRQAVLLCYPLRTDEKGPIHLGFALFFPANHIVTPIVFGVADRQHSDLATTAR